jgi:molybdenum cofactor biosynthesis enzyme MoaA
MINLFTEYPPYRIDVSLYGCDGESYKAVTGHDVYETVTTNIRAAIAEGLHVQLMIVPSAYMLPWVDRVMEYAGTFGADDVMVNGMLMEANLDTGRSMEDFGLSLEENERIHRRQRDMFPRKPKTQTEEEAEFIAFIKSFNADSRPKISELLRKYAHKRIIVFCDREEAENFLNVDFERIQKYEEMDIFNGK